MAVVPGTEGRKVVIDAGAAIKLQRLERLGSELFTTSNVLAEIRDEKARALLSTLPVELKIREPLPEDMAYVKQFAKATGDFHVLSMNDMQLIALTVNLHRAAGGRLRERPEPLATGDGGTMAFDWAPARPDKAPAPSRASASDAGSTAGGADKEAAPEEDDDGWQVAGGGGRGFAPPRRRPARAPAPLLRRDDDAVAATGAAAAAVTEGADAAAVAPAEAVDGAQAAAGAAEQQFVDLGAKLLEQEASPLRPVAAGDDGRGAAADEAGDDEEDADSEDGSSAGEWVTPENMHRFGVGVQPDAEVRVTCASSDYAVQNVLLQMGITPLTFDGYAVRCVKMWGLICRACFFFTRESGKVFCPKCGHDTLVRVPIVVDAEGKMTAVNQGRKLRRKGTVFSMPKPEGGRGWKPILAEDELKIGGRDREQRRLENLYNKERVARDPFNEDSAARGWYQRGTTNTGKMLTGGPPRMQAGFGRRNPNANNFGGFKGHKKR